MELQLKDLAEQKAGAVSQPFQTQPFVSLIICNKILRRTTKLRKQYMGFLARTGLFIYELYKAVINFGSFLVEILLNGSRRRQFLIISVGGVDSESPRSLSPSSRFNFQRCRGGIKERMSVWS
jgi:hypothetical protein